MSAILPPQRRVLVVDDDPASLAIVAEALQWDGYQVTTAASGAEAMNLLESGEPDLVILDLHMPNMDGLQAIEMLREKTSYTAVLFISGDHETASVVAALEAGGDDYLRKPFDPRELLARVKTQLRIKDLNDNLRSANIRLQELVEIDDLTGLLNMRSLYQKLDFELDRARRFSRQVAVVMMDMDHFKMVNDGHDHLFGSYVLGEVGKIVKQTIRNIDIAARYGGDEFLICLTEVNPEGARAFCERLRSNVAKTHFSNGKDEIDLTCSIGVAVTLPSQSVVDAKELVRAADMCLYEAKHAGRNCVKETIFQGEPLPPQRNRRRIA